MPPPASLVLSYRVYSLMIFDDMTLEAGYRAAGQVAAAGQGLSGHDLKLVLLAAVAESPLPDAKLEGMRKKLNLEYDGRARLQWIITAICELDRLMGDRELPPTQLVDLMSHLQIFRDELPEGAAIQCHGDAMLPLAAHFAQCGARVFFTGSEDLAKVFSKFLGKNIVWQNPAAPYVQGAYHYSVLPRAGSSLNSFFNKIAHTDYGGLILLTSWSFLNTDNSRMLTFKQRVIGDGHLRVAIQLPPRIMPKMLGALLQFAPRDETGGHVRLINAREWSMEGHEGLPELSYLRPILNLVDGIAGGSGENHLRPGLPSEDVSLPDLILRRCDLRAAERKPVGISNARQRLDDCCMLVRGQMLPQRPAQDTSHSYGEVTLTDIDEYGLVRSASRVIENAPGLTPARKMTLLRKNDILISCKGAIQSLAKVGFVLETVPNCLPNQTFYVARAETVDPIWLFHYLRSSIVGNYLRGRISGTSVAQINVADLASLPVPMPTEAQVAKAHELHAELLKTSKKMEQLRQKLLGKIRAYEMDFV